MKYFYELFTDKAKYLVTITDVGVADKIRIQRISDIASDKWVREQLIPASNSYTFSFAIADEITITAYDDSAVTGILTCESNGLVKYYSSQYMNSAEAKQTIPKVEKEHGDDNGYYEARLLIDDIISKLRNRYKKEDIVSNEVVSIGFVTTLEIIVVSDVIAKNHTTVDTFELLKNVVKVYVENHCDAKLRSLYFEGGYTKGKLLEITKIPIPEFKGEIAMLIIYKKLIGDFAG